MSGGGRGKGGNRCGGIDRGLGSFLVDDSVYNVVDCAGRQTTEAADNRCYPRYADIQCTKYINDRYYGMCNGLLFPKGESRASPVLETTACFIAHS